MLYSRLAFGALLALGTCASAQELRYGVQAHLSLPSGDLKEAVDNKAGLGLGAHLTLDFGQGHLLRPRFDYTAYPDATVFDGISNKMDVLSLGVDYLYQLEGSTGFYVTGGLAANRWKSEVEISGLGTFSSNTTKLGYAAGVGYAFNAQVSAEARLTSTKFTTRTVSDENANAFQLAALYRF